MRADACCDAVHLHIGDRPFYRLSLRIQDADVHPILAQEFPGAVFMLKILTVAALEFINECPGFFRAAA